MKQAELRKGMGRRNDRGNDILFECLVTYNVNQRMKYLKIKRTYDFLINYFIFIRLFRKVFNTATIQLWNITALLRTQNTCN